MLPHVERWLRDPIIAENALHFSSLSFTNAGRDVLVAFLSDATQSTPLRTKAVEQLKQTMAGIDLLVSACADAQFVNMLDDLLDLDSRKYLAAERVKLRHRNGDELWNELIDGLSPGYWLPVSGTILPANVEAQQAEHRRRYAQASLDCLRLLSKHPNLTSQSEWRKWFESESPDVVALDDLLRLMLDHPEMIESTAILRRILPHHHGRIPENGIPLYRQMVQSDNVTMQYWACNALLTFTDSADATNVAINLIDLSNPNDSVSTHSGEIYMLQRRFAVNFFRDTDAWRKWASAAHLTSPGLTD